MASAAKHSTGNTLSKRIYRSRALYLVLLPGMLFFAVFAYGPMYGIQIAFKHYSNRLGIWGSEWIGLENFRLIFMKPEFTSALVNTLIISFMKIAIGFWVPIAIAIAINELTNRKLSRTLQTVFTFPHFLSWVILTGILTNFLSTDGVVNNFIAMLGHNRVNMLANAGVFRWMLVFTDIWKESGWSCIMYLAAIASIDSSLYESATIDGANRLHRALYITLPGISGMAAILLVLQVGNAMNANFDQIFNLYNPPVFSTGDVLDTYIYRISFQQQANFGFSTAVSLFKGVVNFILLAGANIIKTKIDGQSILD
jgi:putative aldouronate transport system permease protein